MANIDDLYCDNLRMRCRLVSTCLMYRYIQTYIHKYSGFLVVLISVGLAQARPNYLVARLYFHDIPITVNLLANNYRSCKLEPLILIVSKLLSTI